jgi:hypothetical protein
VKRIQLSVTFADDDGTARHHEIVVNPTYEADLAGERRLAKNLFAELKLGAGEQAEPKHNLIASAWMESPKIPTGLVRILDVLNSRAIWFELGSLVMGTEGDLILSEAYKKLEPAKEPPFEDDAAINDLYYLHDRKMMLLNQAVYSLIKVQDLVNRLLHESLGGDLVDVTKPDWEKSQLLRRNVKHGLESKRAHGSLTQVDFDLIMRALAIPEDVAEAKITETYRNRLLHHTRPSVDYAMFFSSLDSRVGKEILDTSGTVVAHSFPLRARAPVEYRFGELHGAFSRYLDHVVAMLEELNQIRSLRP